MKKFFKRTIIVLALIVLSCGAFGVAASAEQLGGLPSVSGGGQQGFFPSVTDGDGEWIRGVYITDLNGDGVIDNKDLLLWRKQQAEKEAAEEAARQEKEKQEEADKKETKTTLSNIFTKVGDIGESISNMADMLNPMYWFEQLQKFLSDWFYDSVISGINSIYSLISTVMSTAFFSNNYVSKTLDFFRWFANGCLAIGLLFAIAKEAEKRAYGEPTNFVDITFNFVKAYIFVFCVKPGIMFLHDWSSKFINWLSEIKTQADNAVEVPNLVPSVALIIILLIVMVVSVKVMAGALRRMGVIYLQIIIGYITVFDIVRGNLNVFGDWCRDVIAGFISFTLQIALYRTGMNLVLSGFRVYSGTTNLLSISDLMVGLVLLLTAAATPQILRRWGFSSKSGGGIMQKVSSLAMLSGRFIR